MPYEIALRLARRYIFLSTFTTFPPLTSCCSGWHGQSDMNSFLSLGMRFITSFGLIVNDISSARRPTFPSTCLSPDQPGYGQVVNPAPGKRRTRRHREVARAEAAAQDWTIISPAVPHPGDEPAQGTLDGLFTYQPRRPADSESRHHMTNSGSSVELYMPYGKTQAYPTPSSVSPPPLDALTAKQLSLSCSPSSSRYAPYPSPLSPGQYASRASPAGEHRRGSGSSISEDIRLPPLVVPDRGGTDRRTSISLPPISTMDSPQRGRCDDSAAVLRRLQSPDEDDLRMPSFHAPGSSYSYRSSPSRGSVNHLSCSRASSLNKHLIHSRHLSSPSSTIGPRLSAVHLSSSGRASPSAPYLSPSSPHSHGSINDVALHRLPTPPSSRSSLGDARAYLSPRSPEGSAQERGVMSAPKHSFYDAHQ